MIIVKSPLRISLFGGSTDYESFYKKHGSFIIGTTINKYVYLFVRQRPSILSEESVIAYSKTEMVSSWDDIKNPLIRETLKYSGINQTIDFNSFSDIPARTGLGGSSSFCVGLLKALAILQNKTITPKSLATNAITIERNILQEAGGVQDQIWAAYGGFNSIEITKSSKFLVKPLPITDEFKKSLEKSIILIYTGEQRKQDLIAKSHENKNKTEILNISKEAYSLFIKEDIKSIGHLLYESWKNKSNISTIITTPTINNMMDDIIRTGAYGVKLLGAGGCGFILAICNSRSIKKIKEKFQKNIMDVKFDPHGAKHISLQSTHID